jgi:hypothetical protein
MPTKAATTYFHSMTHERMHPKGKEFYIPLLPINLHKDLQSKLK